MAKLISRMARRMTERSRYSSSLAAVVAVTILLVSIILFVNATPTVSVTSGCNVLTPGQIPRVGQSGAIRFGCNGVAALSGTGTATPSFSLSTTGYTSLGITLHASKNCNQARTINSGVAVSFGSSKNDYDYCAIFHNPSLTKLGSFKVTWTTGKT